MDDGSARCCAAAAKTGTTRLEELLLYGRVTGPPSVSLLRAVRVVVGKLFTCNSLLLLLLLLLGEAQLEEDEEMDDGRWKDRAPAIFGDTPTRAAIMDIPQPSRQTLNLDSILTLETCVMSRSLRTADNLGFWTAR